MKLVFYSGGTNQDNQSIDEAMKRLTGKKNPKITCIPSESDDGPGFMDEVMDYFSPYGIHDFVYFPIDRAFTKAEQDRAFNTDIIFLSGGNTYYFLKHLKKSGILEHLKSFVENGGILVGESAGSILMTPSIHTASVPHFDGDHNHVGIKNLNAMSLVDFEFIPHYKNEKKYDSELTKYSKTKSRLLVACTDGSGVVVNGKEIRYHGEVYGFLNGRKINLSVLQTRD